LIGDTVVERVKNMDNRVFKLYYELRLTRRSTNVHRGWRYLARRSTDLDKPIRSANRPVDRPFQ